MVTCCLSTNSFRDLKLSGSSVSMYKLQAQKQQDEWKTVCATAASVLEVLIWWNQTYPN